MEGDAVHAAAQPVDDQAGRDAEGTEDCKTNEATLEAETRDRSNDMKQETVPSEDVANITDNDYVDIKQDSVTNKEAKEAVPGNAEADQEAVPSNTEVKEALPSNTDAEQDAVPDEYNYTKREEFTSEIFKLSITNLPKKFGFVEFKKKLAKLEVKPVKLKVARDICYITFKCEQERMEALEKINGLNWRGRPMIATTAAPAADPLMKKRRLEETGDGADVGNKKARVDLDSCSPTERLKNSVTPLWKLEYSEQLKKKEEEMRSFFKGYHRQLEKNCPDLKSWLRERRQKYGSIPCELQKILPSPVTEGYRNKCEFTIGPGEEAGSSVVGFRYGTYAKGNVCVGSPLEVAFLPDIMKPLLKVFQDYLTHSIYPAYNPETHIGHWRQLTVRTSALEHLMILIDFNPQTLTQADLDLEKERLKTFFTEGDGKCCNVTSAYFRAHTDKTTSSEMPYTLLFGNEFISESLLGMKFHISPSAFFQVNTLCAEVLYTTVADWCQAGANTTVLDVCCGTGTIGLTVAKRVEKVIGIEMCSEAIDDAKINADINGIKNISYHCAKAEDVMKEITRSVRGNDDVVAIVDPPRGGLHSSVVVAMRNCRSIKRLVYVSCNAKGAQNNLIDLVRPTSKRLVGPRFRPVKAVPVDLFPHTNHCELVMLFEREEEEDANND